MLTREQIDRENDRKWALDRRAANWRSQAHRMRENATHMGADDNIRAALMIAATYDYLAAFEEKPLRLDL